MRRVKANLYYVSFNRTMKISSLRYTNCVEPKSISVAMILLTASGVHY